MGEISIILLVFCVLFSTVGMVFLHDWSLHGPDFSKLKSSEHMHVYKHNYLHQYVHASLDIFKLPEDVCVRTLKYTCRYVLLDYVM
jgi:hypothetical protein